MSTTTHSDSIASTNWIESVGKASLAGVVAAVLLVSIASWNPLHIAFGEGSLSELGVDEPGVWFVVSPILVAAAGLSILFSTALKYRIGWLSRRGIDFSYFFGAGGVIAVFLVAAFGSSQIPTPSPKAAIVAVVAIGVLSGLSDGFTNRWLRFSGRKRLAFAVLVLVAGIAVPSGIGMALDHTSSQDDGVSEDWDDYTTPEWESPPPEDRITLESVAVNAERPENLTRWDPARVEPLRGEIAKKRLVEGDTNDVEFVLYLDHPTANHSTILDEGAVEPGYEPGDLSNYSLLRDERFELTSFDDPGVVYLYIDVEENGEIVRYQRAVDLSELK